MRDLIGIHEHARHADIGDRWDRGATAAWMRQPNPNGGDLAMSTG